MVCFACVVERPQPQAGWADSLANNLGIQSCSRNAAFQVRSPFYLPVDVLARRCWAFVESSEKSWSKVSVRPAEGVMISGKDGRRVVDVRE
jgi:hypothetical protein